MANIKGSTFKPGAPGPDNYEFDIVSEYHGYVSAIDPTHAAENVLIRGSINVYKKISGTIANRPGLLKRGAINTAIAGVKSSFEWNTSFGAELSLRVANGLLQVENDIVTPGTFVWYNLITGITTLTRYIFDTWWNDTLKKDELIMVRGDSNLLYWHGGMSVIASGTSSTLVKRDTGTTFAQDGFDTTTLVQAGDSSSEFTMTNPSGSTFRYTWDGTGTTPSISATTCPIGSYVLVSGQHFSAGNNGLFQVTGVGANYFEVTNASGVAEATKTIGSGYLYLQFTKILQINGSMYGYTGGETSTTLTGVVPSASAVTANSVAINQVIILPNLPVAGFTNDFIKVINNMLYCCSYSSRYVYISSNTDFTNYTIPSPRTPGAPELLTLDNSPVGISVSSGNPYIAAGTADWYVISYNEITVGSTLTEQTKVDKQTFANGSIPLAHEFIDTVGNNIVYLSQDQQLRSYGIYRNIVDPKSPSLSLEIKQELIDEDFTGGHLRAIGDFIYITAPNTGRDWMYETRESLDATGNIIAERFWHPPQVRNVSRFAVIDGVLYGHSNANPMIYQIWDTLQWHDDGPDGQPIPYDSVAFLSYRNFGRRQGMWRFDKVYTEGYITDGTNLYANIYFDYQGSNGIQNVIINSIDKPAQFFTTATAGPLGISSMGDNPLGEGLVSDTSDQDLLPKFKVINDVTAVDCFEYAVEIYSIDVDCRWEISDAGANATRSLTQPGYIRK